MLVLLATLVWQNTKIQGQIAYEQHERVEARSMAKRIIELKKVMKSPQKSQLDNFLKSSVFGGSDLSFRVKNGRYIINSKRMNARQLESVFNRVLNMNVKVAQLKVQGRDDRYVSFYMEIVL
jgi:hypothetical protein